MRNRSLPAVTLFLCISVGVNASTVLIQSPGVVKVCEGGTVQIQCVLESDNVEYTVDKYTVHWYNSRNKLTAEESVFHLTDTGKVYRSDGFSDRFQLSRNIATNSYSLTISNVMVNDSKFYICGIWGTIFGKGTQLNVTSADVPVLIQSLSIQRVTEGHTAWLWCTMSKTRLEDTDVHWYRKLPGQDMGWILTHRAGGRSERGQGFTRKVLPYRDTSNNSFALVLTDVVHSDSGVYYCRVWGDIDGNGTQLIVTKMSRAPPYLAWLILAVVLGVLAVTGGIFLIRRRAFRNHPSHPPTETDHRSPGADYENVSVARGVLGSGGHQVDSNNTYTALQRPTQSIYGHLQADNKPPSRS
ncbi:uncharacterized protein LOC134350340 isoform X2 [Mobula hypostoma]|uniref:uncharacterized protein LOC134350340 isoform X2 n=1 Tax=Mobula hypostoma TaxID=723540 RepID=UPI002FC3A567